MCIRNQELRDGKGKCILAGIVLEALIFTVDPPMMP